MVSSSQGMCLLPDPLRSSWLTVFMPSSKMVSSSGGMIYPLLALSKRAPKLLSSGMVCDCADNYSVILSGSASSREAIVPSIFILCDSSSLLRLFMPLSSSLRTGGVDVDAIVGSVTSFAPS